MATEKETFVLIDGHAMLYRAWFAFPQTLTTVDGKLVNAVYGFTRILLTVLNEIKPTYLAVSFDVGKTFRHEQYPAYKAHREKMPEELKEQEPMVDRVLNALNVPVFAKDGFEADDVIGTLSRQASRYKLQGTQPDGGQASDKLSTVIVTGDKDVLQLVVDGDESRGGVRVYMPGRRAKGPVIYNERLVKEDLGVRPDQIPDLKGLMGDSSDNIPGIKGIGPKTAVALLDSFGSVEELYKQLATSDKRQATGLKEKLIEKLITGKESAVESKQLATIICDVPITLDLAACELKQYDKEQVVHLFKELEFTSLVEKLPADEFEESVQEALF
jgi:DNA polymerase I